MNDRGELARLQEEAAALRDLVRDLSAALTRLVGALPPGSALALAKGDAAGPDRAFELEHWEETIEMTGADVASEMELLWKRLSPRESA